MTKIYPFSVQPKWSRLAAKRVQNMPGEIRIPFVKAMEKATTIDDMPEPYKGYLIDGYNPIKPAPLSRFVVNASDITFPAE